jgi:hypothetical protein
MDLSKLTGDSMYIKLRFTFAKILFSMAASYLFINLERSVVIC